MSVSLKSDLAADVRRFTFPKTGCFTDLQRVFRELYRATDDQLFIVKYQDDEGDLITVTNDAELTECLQISEQFRIRFKLAAVTRPQAEVPVLMFDSWVELLSEAQSHLQKLAPPQTTSKVHDMMQEFHLIESKVEGVRQMAAVDTTVAVSVPEVGSATAVSGTPTGEQSVTFTPIRELVKILSADIAKQMVDLSCKISQLIQDAKSDDAGLQRVKEMLLDATDLANQCLSTCRVLSDEALETVTLNSDSIMALVASDSNLIMRTLDQIYSNTEQRDLLTALSNSTLKDCHDLSSNTRDQCLSDAESIAAVIRNL